MRVASGPARGIAVPAGCAPGPIRSPRSSQARPFHRILDHPRHDPDPTTKASRPKGADQGLSSTGVPEWMGVRPSHPGSNAVIGSSPLHGIVWIALGNDRLGLTMGDITGQLVSGVRSREGPGPRAHRVQTEPVLPRTAHR